MLSGLFEGNIFVFGWLTVMDAPDVNDLPSQHQFLAAFRNSSSLSTLQKRSKIKCLYFFKLSSVCVCVCALRLSVSSTLLHTNTVTLKSSFCSLSTSPVSPTNPSKNTEQHFSAASLEDQFCFDNRQKQLTFQIKTKIIVT